ncbi:HAD-IIA family hydrolase [Aeromicrobium stalagmiti]|uniref:HAD-IIA family hydrolase n=1 Tax=Aeromicrobium stalagmiti TaxID=2738988 RepID=UPI0015685C75|nr:HAD-IIA family hydrolase [Aeromicrobium stalagmiti]NRQ51632.1 HAD-IIA family hydrolase [Aeromicrobium stalagmiti]
MTSSPHQSLGSTTRELSSIYDLAMLDLDGVVYLGPDVIAGASEALAAARGVGIRLAYITNNASKPAIEVADKLRAMQMPDLDDADVVTSAQAVAHLMADALPSGSPVLLVGGEGLRVPLEDRGLRCVSALADGPVAVVQGFHPDIGWHQLSEASYAIQAGLPWYVSNTDMTVPTPRGIAPGNGSLVQAVRNATGAEPIVAGKPERALFDETIARVGGDHPLMVGDRLDTDIDGAINAGIDSLAVLTGVSTLATIVAAPVGHRPTYVAADLHGLGDVHREVVVDGQQARCGDAEAICEEGVVRVVSGQVGATDTLRAVVELAWQISDRSDTLVVLDGTLDA